MPDPTKPIGVLFMAYGGPESLDEIPGYLSDIRHGRPTTQAVLDEITNNYRSIGGKSPIMGLTKAQVEGAMAQIETPMGRFRARNPEQLAPGAEAMLFVRPEAMRIGGDDNRFEAHLVRRDLEGAFLNLFFDAQGTEIAVHVTNDGHAPELRDAAPMQLGFASEQAVILPRGALARTGQELAAQ